VAYKHHKYIIEGTNRLTGVQIGNGPILGQGQTQGGNIQGSGGVSVGSGQLDNSGLQLGSGQLDNSGLQVGSGQLDNSGLQLGGNQIQGQTNQLGNGNLQTGGIQGSQGGQQGPTGNLNQLLGGIALGGPNGAINQGGGIGSLLSGASFDPSSLSQPGGLTTVAGANPGQPQAGGITLAATGGPLQPQGQDFTASSLQIPGSQGQGIQVGGGSDTLSQGINQALQNAQLPGLSTSL